MWHQYHQVHTTSSFRERWSKFVELTTKQQASPVFYQYVTDVMFKELITNHFPVESRPSTTQRDVSISNEERNAIRYAAGYTVRALRKKIEASSHPLKEELILALVELIGDDEDECQEASAEWIDLIDRGGLWHVSTETYMFFCAIEEELRRHLNVSAIKELSCGLKDQIKTAIVSSDDVGFYWRMLCTEAEEEEKEALLPMIADLWITIRGFSFARSWLEMFKQSSKKRTQRARALRKELN